MCGYAGDGLQPETKEALAKFAPDAELLDFTGDDYAYWHAIKERWTGDEDLVIIEQDIVITESTIPSFEACDQEWCSFGYIAVPHLGRVSACLGCTRFAAKIQREHPLSGITGIPWAKEKTDIPWVSIDVTIGTLLGNSGFRPHDHGDVEHLHDYSSIKCFNREAAEFDENGVYTSNDVMFFCPPSIYGQGDVGLLGFQGFLVKEGPDNG
jgi:hypothetical protein